MKILQVNTTDRGGGAETIVRELHEGYRRAGHEAVLAVGVKRGTDAHTLEISQRGRPLWERGLLHLASNRSSRSARLLLGAISNPRRALRALRGHENFVHPGTHELLGTGSDVVHLHNLHGDYFDLRALPAISAYAPTIITMHDAWLTTGHCAHSFDCERWTAGCGSCPYLDTYPAVLRDATAFNWRRKQEIFARSRIWLVTPSEWLMERVTRSILEPAIAGSQVIPNGIDLDIFSPRDTSAARDALGLPRDAIVLMAAAYGLESNPFKDYPTLREAVRAIGDALPDRRVILLAAGGSISGTIGRVEVRSMTFADQTAMAGAYAAASIFLHAAHADTFPVVILEALACGTPIVATAVGGIRNQLRDGETGYLTPAADPTALAQAVLRVVNDEPALRQMRTAARSEAESRFGVQRMVDDYLRLFEKMNACDS